MSADCRLCGSRDLDRFERGGWRYARCRGCTTLQKLLTREEYLALEPAYDPGPAAAFEDGEVRRRYLNVAHNRRFLRSLRMSGAAVRFLDIGCGAGGYLLAARELGWEPSGVEPSHEHSTLARSLGFDVTQGYFEPGLFGEHRFDVILLSHVIEHILEPRPFLEGVVSILAPRGKLVLVTPNADAVVARASGRYWPMLKTIDHVSLLGPRSVPHLGLERFGRVSTRQLEELWEASATLGSASRDLVRERWLGRRAPSSVGEARNAAPVTRSGTVRWDRRMRAVRATFAVTSLPIYLLGRATGRRACLVIQLERSS